MGLNSFGHPIPQSGRVRHSVTGAASSGRWIGPDFTHSRAAHVVRARSAWKALFRLVVSDGWVTNWRW